ncbi:hypothetical protein [Sphingomonas sp. Leaf37]|uniref:hypothetical protein n=1 Tax=Sphingomonas sp. Leaf37 TaxID=2876552 RepID=UPI001E355840|nr:hypothetical protein [Sphingomonas sp. Leaf37]
MKRLISALLMLAAPAAARDWPDAGGFEIHEGDEFCYLWSEYQGPGESVLSLALRRDKGVMLMVLNDGWSAVEGKEYKDLSFRLDGVSYDGGLAKGTANAGKRGFIQPMNEDFLPHFVRSTYLHVYKGEKLIDRLTLEGSAAAVSAVQRCLAHVDGLRRGEERERKRYEDIEKDPFANSQ